MCLLVSQPKTVSFTDSFLSDVYDKNSDGLGVMYAEDGKLHIYKCLPANAKDFIDFYRKHAANRGCMWHARMRTHGDVDKDNCHPYQVTDDIWLAHNGILSTGNYADHTKSDTWHFIKNVLRPALTAQPDLMLDKEWIDFMGDLIGSGNKFGLVRADGESCIINRRQGVEFMQSWLSNTYAWSPSRFGFQGQARWKSSWEEEEWSYYDSWKAKGSNNGAYWTPGHGRGTTPQVIETKPAPAQLELLSPQLSRGDDRAIRTYLKAVHNSWARKGKEGVQQWVKDAPHKAAAVLNFYYDDMTHSDLNRLIYEDNGADAADWISDLFASETVTPSWLA